MKYYKQNLIHRESNQTKSVLPKMLAQYKALGWTGCTGIYKHNWLWMRNSQSRLQILSNSQSILRSFAENHITGIRRYFSLFWCIHQWKEHCNNYITKLQSCNLGELYSSHGVCWFHNSIWSDILKLFTSWLDICYMWVLGTERLV